VNKAELLHALVKRTDLPARDVKSVVDANFHPADGVLAKAMKKGDKVVIAGFGAFEQRKCAARTARNPQTGDAVKVKARKVPAFRAGASLKEAVR